MYKQRLGGLIMKAFILTFVLLLSGCTDPEVPTRLYLQNATPTSMIVKWRTSNSVSGSVRYGTSSGSLNLTANGPSASDHEIRLSNLNPGSTYYYQVVSGSDATATYQFKTPTNAGDTRPFRAWLLGDSGTANSSAESVRNAFNNFNGGPSTDIMLMLGDNAYLFGNDNEYQKAVFDMYPESLRTTPLWSTLGNHDNDTVIGAPPYWDIFTLPTQGEAGGVPSGTESYYSFTYGNVHFICLNSESGDRSVGGAMYRWAESDLAASTEDWIVVFFHHPPYSKGSHDSDSETELVEMRQNFVPLFDRYRVDMVFSGHSHSYERSFLVKDHTGTSNTLQPSMKVNGGDGRENGNGAYTKLYSGTHNGVVYTTAGSSGQVGGGSLNHPVHYISTNTLGSVVLDFNGNRVDARFITSGGQVGDYFTMKKL